MKNKYVLDLTAKERHLCLNAMLNFRNKVLARGIDTGDTKNDVINYSP